MKLLLHLILVVIIFSPLTVRSQESRTLEVLRMSVDMAETNYSFRKGDDTLSDLVIAYERYLVKRCMPELERTLRYNGVLDAECRKLIAKIYKLNPNNPVALCAEEGIDAIECEVAYDSQLLYMLKPFQINSTQFSSVVDLDFKLAASQEKDAIERLNIKLADLIRRNRTGRKPEAEEQKKEVIHEILQRACRASRIIIQSSKSPILGNPAKFRTTTVDFSEEKEETVTELLGEFVEEYAEGPALATPVPTIGPEVEKEAINRIRYITESCYYAITQAINLAPETSQIECAQFGKISPQCIQARRLEKQFLPDSGKGSNTGHNTKPNSKGGFVEF